MKIVTSMQIRQALMAARDPSVAAYMEKVVSDTAYPMLYVRMEAVRKIAKSAAYDYAALVKEADGTYFEEVMCTGLAVAYGQDPLAMRLSALERLMPHWDSWALTDSILPTLRFRPEERVTLFAFAKKCLEGREEYTIRSGVVILLRFFLQKENCQQVAQLLMGVKDQRYYVQMAVSWCFAEMAVTDFNTVENVLKSGELDPFIHNKTIQKIRESYRIPAEIKEKAYGLRRK